MALTHPRRHVIARPFVPEHVVLRDYQTEAIENWLTRDGRGLLEMATGTGKTITALAASVKLYERERRLAVIIAVPYQHLVEQWRAEATRFGYRPVSAYRSVALWRDKLNERIADYNAGYRDFISVIVTHQTFSRAEFQNALARLTHPALLIADEAHHLGAEHHRTAYPSNIQYRLALSATPDR